MKDGTEKNNLENDLFADRLQVLVKAIIRIFGSPCEVVLHDIRQLDKYTRETEYGHVAGRKAGNSITNLALRKLRENNTVANDLFLNYRTTTKSSKPLESATAPFRNEKRKPIAALCINTGVENLEKANSAKYQVSGEFHRELDATY
jgi:predicted transcriptional regulator YheO